MKRILMLEDDWELAADWRTALESRGYCVTHEAVVDNAIEALRTATFDLVITDILIRDSDNKIGSKGGLSLLSFISLEMKVKPKTLAVSGAAPQVKVLDHATLLKADRTLNKPATADEVVALVEELLGQSGD
jgi:ActR/RegA family two-component response regulator